MIELARDSRYYAPSKDHPIALPPLSVPTGAAVSFPALDEAHKLCSRYKRTTTDTGQPDFACGSQLIECRF
jgi:hypothetical protein